MRKAALVARSMGHSFVGSEHILLALSAREDLPAGQALLRSTATYPRLYGLLSRLRGQGEELKLPQGLSPGAREIICTAMEQLPADKPIRPEHLLRAIATGNSTTAALLLVGCGVCTQQLYADTLAAPLKQPEKKGGTMRLLEQFGVNMVEKAGTMGPVIGREGEIDTIIEVLCRKHKHNPALVGDPGVGKTAIVEGLAQRMAVGQVPPQLRDKRLIALDTASMVAGTKYRGEFEERMRDILAEIQRTGNIIVFIDEMHMLVGAGAAEGAIDAANILKPALSRGELQLIGATTLEEYRKFIEKDAALERRFRQIKVQEPSAQQTLEILRGLRPGLERHHGLPIGDDAIEAAVALSQRYLCEYFLPDKAIDLLDEGAAHACLWAQRSISQKEQIQRRTLDDELKAAISQEDFAKALQLQAELRTLYEENAKTNVCAVSALDVAYAVRARTGIPVSGPDDAQRKSLQALEAALAQHVVGQDKALKLVAEAVRRGRTGLSGQNRPTAAILLTGPSGVGKTELCKALAECVYGSRNAMIRLDMTEYMEKHTISRLLGAPPGYVGYDEGGTLTEKVRRNPYSLVLFDEIDKAHPDVTGILLQVMDDGRLTDSLGRTVDFTNTLLLMTANIGAREGNRGGLGFVASGEKDRTLHSLRQHFSPEFLGRLDAVAIFQSLDKSALTEIAQMQLNKLAERALAKGVSLTWDMAVAESLANQCRVEGGARQIRSLLQQQVEAPLAQRLLTESEGASYCILVQEGALVLQKTG